MGEVVVRAYVYRALRRTPSVYRTHRTITQCPFGPRACHSAASAGLRKAHACPALASAHASLDTHTVAHASGYHTISTGPLYRSSCGLTRHDTCVPHLTQGRVGGVSHTCSGTSHTQTRAATHHLGHHTRSLDYRDPAWLGSPTALPRISLGSPSVCFLPRFASPTVVLRCFSHGCSAMLLPRLFCEFTETSPVGARASLIWSGMV